MREYKIMRKKWIGVLAACVFLSSLPGQAVLAQPQGEYAKEMQESGTRGEREESGESEESAGREEGAESADMRESAVRQEREESVRTEESSGLETEGRSQKEQKVRVESGSGLVMDLDTQTVLYEKNGERTYYPASITKLLTALVVVENCDLDETVIFSHDAVYDVESGSGNNQSLEAGDKLTVEECLYAMLLESSNPAANALAEHTSGSINRFVYEMNEKADELGCRHSRFQNPSGLNDETQTTTAYDMALISCEVFENEDLREICSAQRYQLPPTLNQPEGYLLQMEHKLINGEETSDSQWDFVGGKTGYTSMAGNTLVTYVEEDGKKLVAVVMNSDMTHYSDTRNLLKYGFANVDALVKPQEEEEDLQAAEAEQAASHTAAAAEEPQIQEMEQKSTGIPPVLKIIGCVAAGIIVAAVHLYQKAQERRRKRRRLAYRRKRRELQMRQQQEEYEFMRRYLRSGR